MRRYLLHLSFIAAWPLMLAATDTMTGVFDEHIKSLQVRFDGDDFSPAAFILGSDERIRISFDNISEEREYFRYSLTHCNADWQPSGLMESEFLDGFNEGSIEDYRFSGPTTVHYVHYELTIPNADVSPTVSGNYLLRIYREDSPEQTVLQCRFMVNEATARLSVGASSQTDIDYNKTHQQVSVLVDTEDAGVEDVFNDLLVVVQQNGRLDNEVAVRHPLRASGKLLYYEHLQPLIFEAGNEYRRFEIVSDSYPGMGVEDIGYYRPYYHYRLRTDMPRDEAPYSYDQTQHGRYFIREYNSADSDVDADYGVVHFSLDYPYSPGTMIFLDGDFTARRFDDNARMTYNSATGRYERAMLLKQGAYNYQYLIVPPGAGRGYTGKIEGDKYQTINEYTVKVYHRRRGERFDRLIGIGSTRTAI